MHSTLVLQGTPHVTCCGGCRTESWRTSAPRWDKPAKIWIERKFSGNKSHFLCSHRRVRLNRTSSCVQIFTVIYTAHYVYSVVPLWDLTPAPLVLVAAALSAVLILSGTTCIASENNISIFHAVSSRQIKFTPRSYSEQLFQFPAGCCLFVSDYHALNRTKAWKDWWTTCLWSHPGGGLMGWNQQLQTHSRASCRRNSCHRSATHLPPP